MIPRTFKKYMRGGWWEVDIISLRKDAIFIAESVPNCYSLVLSDNAFEHINSDGEKVKAVMTSSINLEKGIVPYVWRE